MIVRYIIARRSLGSKGKFGLEVQSSIDES